MPKPQRTALALFAQTLLVAQSVQQTRVARTATLFCAAKPVACERRYQRFLTSTVKRAKAFTNVQQQWANCVLSYLPQHRKHDPLVLLVDETCLQEHVRVMAVCLAWHGRSLPLAWRAYPAEASRCQVDLILALLTQIRAVVPAEQTVVVEADRGIGASPTLLRGIATLGWFYLVRVMNTVRVRFEEDEQEVPIGSFLREEGASVGLRWGEAFKKSGWLECGILGCFEKGQKEGWCLVTNYPQATCRGYALRMWVESCFKDMKSGSWNWHLSRLHEAERVERLWLVMALSTLFSCLLGSAAARDARLSRWICRGKERRGSYLQWGMALFWVVWSGRLPVEAVVAQARELLPCLPNSPFAPSPPESPPKLS